MSRAKGFVCHVCGGDTKVVDSRPGKGDVRRRRVCIKCPIRFTTIEVGEEDLKLLLAARAFDRQMKKERLL